MVEMVLFWKFMTDSWFEEYKWNVPKNAQFRKTFRTNAKIILAWTLPSAAPDLSKNEDERSSRARCSLLDLQEAINQAGTVKDNRSSHVFAAPPRSASPAKSILAFASIHPSITYYYYFTLSHSGRGRNQSFLSRGIGS